MTLNNKFNHLKYKDMKKILTLVLLLGITSSIFAQKKSYVVVYCKLSTTNSAYLTGDIPTSMKSTYSYSDFSNRIDNNTYGWIGLLLNKLASNGFTVENMNTVFNSSNVVTTYLLSKTSSGSSSASKIATVTTDPDEEVTEIARYNLQGIPVKESDKGLQIIVYSNYTTKTVVVE